MRVDAKVGLHRFLGAYQCFQLSTGGFFTLLWNRLRLPNVT